MKRKTYKQKSMTKKTLRLMLKNADKELNLHYNELYKMRILSDALLKKLDRQEEKKWKWRAKYFALKNKDKK